MGIIIKSVRKKATSNLMEESAKSQHTLKYKGFLKGHGGWVTTLAVGEEQVGEEKVEFLMSGSRDKSMIKWDLDMKKDEEEDREWGRPKRMFTGHSHFISEVKLTGDSRFCFSASWDGTVRLWNVATGRTIGKLTATSMKANETGSKKPLACKSLAWSKSGTHLFTGWSDNHIRVYEIEDGGAARAQNAE